MMPRTLLITAGVALLAFSACGASASRQKALELTAILDLRSLQSAQVQYQSQFGRFAANLSELGTARLIPSSLASGEKDGFKFTMTASPNGFAINANPKVYGETGRRTFYSDQTMV